MVALLGLEDRVMATRMTRRLQLQVVRVFLHANMNFSMN
jgi:hypothetical protein